MVISIEIVNVQTLDPATTQVGNHPTNMFLNHFNGKKGTGLTYMPAPAMQWQGYVGQSTGACGRGHTSAGGEVLTKGRQTKNRTTLQHHR